MGRAIIITAFAVVLAFCFVLFQLKRRSAGLQGGGLDGAPVLITRDDGSIYSVGLRLERMESRLLDEERRSLRVMEEVRSLEGQRDVLLKQVAELQEELRRIKEQSAPLPPPEGMPESPGPTGLPPATPPGTPTPGSPGEPMGPPIP